VKDKDGTVEANILSKKYTAEANGIKQKALAMKDFDGPGKEHEEFKLRLLKDKDVELAEIAIQKDIAEAQASVVKEGLQSANIDIVGGESMFFENIVGSITKGKSIDRMVDNSKVLTDVKSTFFDGTPEYFQKQLKSFIAQFNMTSEDIKNLTVSALLGKLMAKADGSSMDTLQKISQFVETKGLGNSPASLIEKLK